MEQVRCTLDLKRRLDQPVLVPAPPKTTFNTKRGLSFRAPASEDAFAAPPPPPQPASVVYKIIKRQGGVNNVNGYAPFNDPLLAAPNYDIAFNSWTAAARLGLIAYAMLPLAITLALKQVSCRLPRRRTVA